MESPRLATYIDESFTNAHLSRHKDLMPQVSQEFQRLLVEGAMQRMEADPLQLKHRCCLPGHGLSRRLLATCSAEPAPRLPRSHLLHATNYGPLDRYGLREVKDYSLPQKESKVPHENGKNAPVGDVVPLSVIAPPHPRLHSLDAKDYAEPKVGHVSDSHPEVKVQDGHREPIINSDGTTRHLKPWTEAPKEAQSVSVGKHTGSTHLAAASPALIPLRTPDLPPCRRRHPALIDAHEITSPFLKALSQRMKDEMADFALGEANQAEVVNLNLEDLGKQRQEHKENVSSRLGMLLARMNVVLGKAEHDTAWDARVAASTPEQSAGAPQEAPREFIPAQEARVAWKLDEGKDPLATDKVLRQETLKEYDIDEAVQNEIGALEARILALRDPGGKEKRLKEASAHVVTEATRTYVPSKHVVNQD